MTVLVSELSDGDVTDGQPPGQALGNTESRMAWPIIAYRHHHQCPRTPLFWPGMVGKFMRYLPATVIIALLASLLMALIFLLMLGSLKRTEPLVEGARASRTGQGTAHCWASFCAAPAWPSVAC